VAYRSAPPQVPRRGLRGAGHTAAFRMSWESGGSGNAAPPDFQVAGAPAGTGRRNAQAVRVPAASSRPSSAIEVSRILNFCTLPVTVMGNSSTKRQ
jgi:hypothetical protein